MGAADFRVGGKIFATLASVSQGYGNLMLAPEQQAAFMAESQEVFLPYTGGWGKKRRNSYPAGSGRMRIHSQAHFAHSLETFS